ncbi:hypothetical protein JX266_006724 [Neoarthrinium moseri]|uniref:uncharacterized protein n=1 Tax=Neoarthrinium moseri TaxID=1658444 RepID=UPI001FDC0BFF|nr:uncharacterized protein JN550_010378 [Neoarthrinium moseri]KAI1847184.1 hypothetical protein JX266_006724 [Neoarthrinium moseri]KAI1862222.1 hypothetical protein JN550_010378 [Neoarthrinium moseri]
MVVSQDGWIKTRGAQGRGTVRPCYAVGNKRIDGPQIERSQRNEQVGTRRRSGGRCSSGTDVSLAGEKPDRASGGLWGIIQWRCGSQFLSNSTYQAQVIVAVPRMPMPSLPSVLPFTA